MIIKKPTVEEKRALQGETNVEALLYALDQRVSGETTVIIVGRASYQIGKEVFSDKLRQLLNEDERIDGETGKLFLTEDIDCFHTDAAQVIIDAAHEHSYLAQMAKRPAWRQLGEVRSGADQRQRGQGSHPPPPRVGKFGHGATSGWRILFPIP